MLTNIYRQLAPDAPYVTGFHVDRYALADFDRDLRAAGFALESRFSTWDLRPWTPESEFAVSILRKADLALRAAPRVRTQGTRSTPCGRTPPRMGMHSHEPW